MKKKKKRELYTETSIKESEEIASATTASTISMKLCATYVVFKAILQIALVKRK